MKNTSKIFFYIYVALGLSQALTAAYPEYQVLGGQVSQSSLDPISGKPSLVYAAQELGPKLLIRLSPAGQPIQAQDASPSHSLTFSTRPELAKGQWQISFLNPNAEARSATVKINTSGQGWNEVSISLPETLREFEGILLQPLMLEEGRAQICFAALRLDPPAYSLDAAQTAQVMGVSIEVAREIQNFNLDELLAWDLMRIAAHGLSPQEILRQRTKKSWGEIAQAAGTSWGQICDEVEGRMQAAIAQPKPGNARQAWRSMANSIGEEAQP